MELKSVSSLFCVVNIIIITNKKRLLLVCVFERSERGEDILFT